MPAQGSGTVACDTNKCYVKRPIIIGVAAWNGGTLRPSELGVEHYADVRLSVEWLDEGQRPGSCTLTWTLAPVLRTFCGADGPSRVVHSFRCVSPAGNERFVSWCASCGANRILDTEDLAAVGPEPCPGCGAAVSEGDCARWHNWGACLRCNEGPVFESARRTVATLMPDVSLRAGLPPFGGAPARAAAAAGGVA
jgi:hypothetical protein